MTMTPEEIYIKSMYGYSTKDNINAFPDDTQASEYVFEEDPRKALLKRFNDAIWSTHMEVPEEAERALGLCGPILAGSLHIEMYGYDICISYQALGTCIRWVANFSEDEDEEENKFLTNVLRTHHSDSIFQQCFDDYMLQLRDHLEYAARIEMWQESLPPF
jgi:hypothetical protein